MARVLLAFRKGFTLKAACPQGRAVAWSSLRIFSEVQKSKLARLYFFNGVFRM
jgi:hypothetical protein